MKNETAEIENEAPPQQVAPNNELLKRKAHKYDDDGCCINCGFDGAEHSWDMRNLRLEIGDDEWLYRKKSGDFDWAEHCGRHERFNPTMQRFIRCHELLSFEVKNGI